MGNSTSDSVFVTFAKTPVTGISLNTTSITGAKIGEPQTLTATVSPTPVGVVGGADCTDVYWYSSDENIAKVDQNGNLTFIEGGDCVIYCTTYDGGYTAQCTVNVITNYSALELLIQQYTDLSLNPDNYFPDSWEEYTQTLTEAQNMLATGGYSQAEVDAMTAELENAYNSLEKYNYIQKVELYLDGEQTKEFYQYDLSLLNGELQYTDAVLDLNVRLYPNNGSYASVEWASSTSDISVTGEGQCSPTIKESCYGRITCTVTDHFGNQFSDSVWVSFARYPVTSLELSQNNISGNINDTYKLTCTVYPVGSSLVHIGAASIQDYFWESDNENVATVAQDGTVTFVGAGSTVVRAVSYDGGISAECVVSCEGDRSALRQALEDYKDVDYTQYIYEFGMNFKTAYENAERVMYDNTVSQQEIDDIKARLREYSERITSGEAEFSTLAILYSEDPVSARRGGELGFFSRAEMVPEFTNVAFSLNDPKKVSKIVETEFGYHIIQLVEKRGDRINCRHILLRPRVSDEELNQTLARMDTLRRDIVDKKISFEEAAQYVSQDKETRNNKGLMVNMSESGVSTTKFQMDQLPQEIAKVVDQMEVGDISEPFTMIDQKRGKEVVVMVKLKARIPGHKANVSNDFQILKGIVEEHKRNEFIDNWIREKQRETYVRIKEGWDDCEFMYDGWIKR